jgi:hypothetical protein
VQTRGFWQAGQHGPRFVTMPSRSTPPTGSPLARRNDRLTRRPKVTTQIGEAKNVHIIHRLHGIIEENEREGMCACGPADGQEVRERGNVGLRRREDHQRISRDTHNHVSDQWTCRTLLVVGVKFELDCHGSRGPSISTVHLRFRLQQQRCGSPRKVSIAGCRFVGGYRVCSSVGLIQARSGWCGGLGGPLGNRSGWLW